MFRMHYNLLGMFVFRMLLLFVSNIVLLSLFRILRLSRMRWASVLSGPRNILILLMSMLPILCSRCCMFVFRMLLSMGMYIVLCFLFRKFH